MPQIVDFEGVQHVFPDDFTPDEISAALDQASQVSRSSADIADSSLPDPNVLNAPAPPLAGAGPGGRDLQFNEPGFNEATAGERRPAPTLGHTVSVGATRAHKGIATILGLPVNLVNNAPRLANLLPGVDGVGPISDSPIGGSDSISPAPVEPVNRTERFVGRIGEELGGAAVPALGLLGKAATTAKESSNLARFFVEPFRQAPVKATATEAALAAGAGGGAQAANESFGDGPASDIAGALTGSVAAGAGIRAGALTGRIAKMAIDPRGSARAAMRDDVGRTLKDNTQEAASASDNAIESENLARAVPGYRPTTGAATNDPGLQSLEYSRQSGPNAGAFAQRRAENNRAVNDALDAAAPKALDDSATRAALETRRARATSTADSITEKRGRDLDAAVADAAPQSQPADAGREIRGTLARGRDRTEAIRDAEAQPSLDEVLTSPATVDTPAVVAVIDGMLKKDKRPAVRGALDSARRLLNKAGDDDLDTSIDGLWEARKGINDLIAGRAENSTGRYAQRELTAVRDAIDEQIAKVEPEFQNYREKFAEGSRRLLPFDEGAAGRALAKDKLTGQHAVDDGLVAAEFFKAGKGSDAAIQQFETAIGGNVRARAALRDYAMSEAAKARAAGGVKGLESWVEKHRGALDLYSDIRRDLGNVASAEKALARAQRRADGLKAGLSDPRKSTIARYLDREEASQSMGDILAARNPAREMRNLMRTLKGDADAVDGAKKAFWDLMNDGSPKNPTAGIKGDAELGGSPLLKPAKFRTFLRQHKSAMQELYADDPAHLDRLGKIADAVQAGQRTGSVKPPNTSGTPLGLRNLGVPGLTVAGFAARSFAVARGVVSLPYVLVETGLRAGRRTFLKINKKEYEELLDRALLEPEVAKTLAMEHGKNASRIVGRRLRLHLVNEISTGAVEDSTSQKSAADGEGEDPDASGGK